MNVDIHNVAYLRTLNVEELRELCKYDKVVLDLCNQDMVLIKKIINQPLVMDKRNSTYRISSA